MGAMKEDEAIEARGASTGEEGQMGTASCTPTELAIGEWRQPNAPVRPEDSIQHNKASQRLARKQQPDARLQEAGASAYTHS